MKGKYGREWVAPEVLRGVLYCAFPVLALPTSFVALGSCTLIFTLFALFFGFRLVFARSEAVVRACVSSEAPRFCGSSLLDAR